MYTIKFKIKIAYNCPRKIGRILPEERKKKIEKYKQKREKRVWKKRISYTCRKKVADKRLRIKGRFISKAEALNLKEKTQEIIKEETAKEKNEAVINNNPISPSAPSQEIMDSPIKKQDLKAVFSIVPNTTEKI